MKPRGGKQDIRDVVAFTATDGKLCNFGWTENGVKHEVDLVNDGALLRVGSSYYHLKDIPDHPAVLYRSPTGDQYLGVSVDATKGGKISPTSDTVVFTGKGTVHIGSSTVEVQENTISMDGVLYNPGDRVTINGREAVISLGAEL
jgi:uncharacterized protein YjdB